MPTTLLYPYCSLSDVQKETRNSDTNLEDWFKECINRASRAVDEFTHTNFKFHDHASAALSVLRRWVIGHEIWLPWPIITLTEVKENNIVIDPAWYYYEGGRQSIARITNSLPIALGMPVAGEFSADGEIGGSGPRWTIPGGVFTLTLKGTFGYYAATTSDVPALIPESVRRATTLIASAWTMWNRKEVVGGDGDRQSILDSRVPREALALLERVSKLVL